MKKLNIKVGEYDIIVQLRDTNTAKSIYKVCPFNSSVNIWGKEIYFAKTECGRKVGNYRSAGRK